MTIRSHIDHLIIRLPSLNPSSCFCPSPSRDAFAIRCYTCAQTGEDPRFCSLSRNRLILSTNTSPFLNDNLILCTTSSVLLTIRLSSSLYLLYTLTHSFLCPTLFLRSAYFLALIKPREGGRELTEPIPPTPPATPHHWRSRGK